MEEDLIEKYKRMLDDGFSQNNADFINESMAYLTRNHGQRAVLEVCEKYMKDLPLAKNIYDHVSMYVSEN